jgi:signal transduction histidine kinase
MNELEEKLTKSYLKIQRQKQEIEEQSENIKEQKQKLEEQNFDLLNVNEEKNHLIRIVVHGLKNPLTSSLCMTDFLELHVDELPEEYRECIDIIHNSLQRRLFMLNSIKPANCKWL